MGFSDSVKKLVDICLSQDFSGKVWLWLLCGFFVDLYVFHLIFSSCQLELEAVVLCRQFVDGDEA